MVRRIVQQEGSRYERVVLSYLFRSKELIETAVSGNIQPEWFINEGVRDLFEMAVHYYYNTTNLLTKSVYMEDVRNSSKIDPETYHEYETFFNSIYDSCPDDESFDYYFNKFKDDALSKKTGELVVEFMEERKKGTESFGETVKNLTKKLLSLQHNIEEREWQVLDFINEIEPQLEDIRLRKENPEKYAGIPTYYPSVDHWFNGFEKGTLNVVAGRPATGKSTLMKCMSWLQCLHGKKVLIVSCEDDMLMWSHKISSSETGIPLTSIIRGQVTDEESDRLIAYKKEMKKNCENQPDGGRYAILQLGARKFSVSNIEMIVENHFQTWVPDIVFVDQISLIKPGERYGARIDMEFGTVTKDLRAVAKKWHIPIVAASQVKSTAVKEKKGVRVTEIFGEDISQSDQIFQDSDSMFGIEMSNQDKCQYNLKIVKNRNGVADIHIPLRFERDICAFRDPEFVIEGTTSESLTLTGSEISSEVEEVTDKYGLEAFLSKEDEEELTTGVSVKKSEPDDDEVLLSDMRELQGLRSVDDLLDDST